MGNGHDTAAASRVNVWDLPVRLFHWALVALIVSQIVTASVGGNAMEYHVLGGYSILTLVVFRIIWGFVGGHYARFSKFLRAPRPVMTYARSLVRGHYERHAGHNPLGGWSVMLMLACLLVQTVTGLFADDEIMTTGPLEKHVSDATSSLMSAIHEINAFVIVALVTVHIVAVIYYLARWKDNLIAPMFTGYKTGKEAARGDVPQAALLIRAAVALAVSGLAVAGLVNI